MGTCAQEKHLIAPVGCIHLVHGNSGETVRRACADHQGPPLQRVNGLVHEWVGAHEVDHFIRIVLGGFHGWREGSTRALQAGDECQAQAAQGTLDPLASEEVSALSVPTSSTCSASQNTHLGFCPIPNLSAGPAPAEDPRSHMVKSHGHLPSFMCHDFVAAFGRADNGLSRSSSPPARLLPLTVLPVHHFPSSTPAQQDCRHTLGM